MRGEVPPKGKHTGKPASEVEDHQKKKEAILSSTDDRKKWAVENHISSINSAVRPKILLKALKKIIPN